MASFARKFVNRKIADFARRFDKNNDILFVGVHRHYDYSHLFPGCNYKTLDINPEAKPDIVADIQNTKLPATMFNGVILVGVYEFLQSPELAFNEIAKLLRDGGRLLLCAPGYGYYLGKRRHLDPWKIWEQASELDIELMEITYYRNVPNYICVEMAKSKKGWNEYIKWEEKHQESVEQTRQFFREILQKYGQLLTTRTFNNVLEIGAGISGGYASVMENITDVTSIDPIYGNIKIKAENMDFADNLFDLVIISNTLSHCENLNIVSSKVSKVLKPGGIMFIFNYLEEDWHHPHSFKSVYEIEILFPNLIQLGKVCQPKGKRNAYCILFYTKAMQ